MDDQSLTGPFSSRDILDCSNLQPWSKKIDSFTACEPDTERTEQFILQFSNWALQNYLKGSPRTDILLSLVQFNVTRALVMNAKLLGLTSETMARGARSHIASAGINHVTFSNALPSSLLPTSLQRTVPHHPWIDLLPVPELRDNILRQGENSYDEVQLCRDLRGCQSVLNGPGGVIVWGEPWDPLGWEVTEVFAGKWPWLLEGCQSLFESTNYWRATKGEPLTHQRFYGTQIEGHPRIDELK